MWHNDSRLSQTAGESVNRKSSDITAADPVEIDEFEPEALSSIHRATIRMHILPPLNLTLINPLRLRLQNQPLILQPPPHRPPADKVSASPFSAFPNT